MNTDSGEWEAGQVGDHAIARPIHVEDGISRISGGERQSGAMTALRRLPGAKTERGCHYAVFGL